MEQNFWIERWQRQEIGFHQNKAQPALVAHFDLLRLKAGDMVLVPLCGKSLDLTWLAERGLHVVGAELSPLAVKAYFEERGETPDMRRVGDFDVYAKGAVEIWCGDFFKLDARALPACDAIYDRAALVAMPPEMQGRYAQKIAELAPRGSRELLIGLDYNQNEMSGPPFAIPQARVFELFGEAFDVDVIEAKNGLTSSEHLAKRGITRLEEASYLLRRRA